MSDTLLKLISDESTSKFINISTYKFVPLDNLGSLRQHLLEIANESNLKGTILISFEGINMFVAGERQPLDRFLKKIHSIDAFADLVPKESPSEHQPFTRMLVRIKKEIISMGVPTIHPSSKTSPKISAPQLKAWLDEGKPLTLLDVRNDYEVELGTFRNALPIGVDHFRQFPGAVDALPEEVKQQPLVMFCTGGIRCEKAGPLMEEKGFSDVYQLDGGILKYFEECGGEHYDGECFVFDKRVALAPSLAETDTQQCYLCQAILTGDDLLSDKYEPGECCPYCFRTDEEKMTMAIDSRNQQLAAFASPLPGSQPYDNRRPLNVPLKFDQRTAIEFVSELHSHLTLAHWQNEFSNGRILYKQQPLSEETVVRSGWRIEHLLPGTIEPNVDANLKIIFEDDNLIVVDKPAPLPMHACGRFNRNTLLYLLGQAYPAQRLRIAHRLDANTTGIVLVCRKRTAADWFRVQFEKSNIEKTYLARVLGHPQQDSFSCDAPISDGPRTCGQRTVEADGLNAKTEFEVLERMADGTAIVACRPLTGRTNQIRVHCWHLGHAIVGDSAYLPDGELTENQTKTVEQPPMCLHAWKLKFPHVTGEMIELEGRIPEWAGQPIPASKYRPKRK